MLKNFLRIVNKSIMSIYLVGMIGILLCCSSEERNQQENEAMTDSNHQTIPFNRSDNSDLPEEVGEWVDMLQELDRSPLWHTLTVDDTTYLYVGWGEKPTGGYDVSVKRIEKSSADQIEVTVKFLSPSPDDMVTQALTYPFDLISFQSQDGIYNIHPEGPDAPRMILTITSEQPLQPIKAGSASIKLFEPGGNDTVAQGFVVSGLASVFEATVNYRVYNSQGEILTESFTTASDGMNWGYFSFEPEFDRPPEASEEIILELFNIDAKDGEEINDFRVPLNYSEN
jgi:hypothetical protein